MPFCEVSRIASLIVSLALLAALPAHASNAKQTNKSAYARPVSVTPISATPKRIARGKYLAEGVLQCFMCHSERDWSKPGAPPIAGKKGAGAIISDNKERRIVATNITPDVQTGAGKWPDDALVRAIREGVGHDGRPLHPQMWYRSFRALSDEDIASVVVYLRTIPAVKNKLPDTRLSDKLRQQIIGSLQPLTKPVPAPDLSTPLARGRYLIRIADCSGCHTSWHSDRQPGIYAGGNLIERGSQKAFSSNITPDVSGVSYDEEAFIQFMRNGKYGSLHGTMPWIVFRNMSDEDLRAIRIALRRVAPVQHFVNNVQPPSLCKVCLQKHGGGDQNRIVLPKGIALAPSSLQNYVGHYRAKEDGAEIDIRREGNSLFLVSEETRIKLIPLSNRRFAAPGWLAPLRFDFNKQGVVVLVAEEELEDFVYTKMPVGKKP